MEAIKRKASPYILQINMFGKKYLLSALKTHEVSVKISDDEN